MEETVITITLSADRTEGTIMARQGDLAILQQFDDGIDVALDNAMIALNQVKAAPPPAITIPEVSRPKKQSAPSRKQAKTAPAPKPEPVEAVEDWMKPAFGKGAVEVRKTTHD